MSTQCAPDIYVEWSLSDKQVRVFHRGREVGFCGSGIIALRHVLAQDGVSPDTEMLMRYALGELTTLQRGEWYGIRLSQFAFQSTSREELESVESMLGTQVQLLSAVSYRSDSEKRSQYLIAELSQAQDLALLSPKLHLMRQFSGPAFIVTARSADDRYRLRYFAPQFGNDEDEATGSANAVLVQYWSQKSGGGWWRGQQMSPRGGEFLGRIHNQKIELFGRARNTE
jgi:predicted PhzF superfamily epimerase YddE/YHI9